MTDATVGDVLNITYAGNGTDFNSRIVFNAVTLDAVVAGVPEPTSMALLGLGGLALLRRRRS